MSTQRKYNRIGDSVEVTKEGGKTKYVYKYVNQSGKTITAIAKYKPSEGNNCKIKANREKVINYITENKETLDKMNGPERVKLIVNKASELFGVSCSPAYCRRAWNYVTLVHDDNKTDD